MLDNCFRFAPRDSIPGLIAKICKYLKDHPGWSEEELEDQIKKFISATGVESFNGRTGTVTLDKNDVNNLKIASAYFAEGNESIDSLDIVSLYNQGVRFVFTDFNSVTSGYNLAFVLDYFSGSGDVVYYPMSTGSGGGGNIVSVNGKTGVVELSLADIVGTSGVQVKLCTAEEFAATNTVTWNAYYNEGYRIVGVVNTSATTIDSIYILKQDENNHTPIGLSTGSSDAYTPTNPPPYPVSSVNDKTGSVGLKVVDVSNGDSTDENAYIFIDEDEEYPEVVAKDSEKLGGKSLAEIMLALYPVGAVYISVNSTSPAALLGGTWESIGGRFLIGADATYAAGSTGGAATVSITPSGTNEGTAITAAQMPQHRHQVRIWDNAGTKAAAKTVSDYGAGVVNAIAGAQLPDGHLVWKGSSFEAAQGGYGDPSGITDNAGNGGEHTHTFNGTTQNIATMPPYLAVYMWKRVS